MKRFFYTDVLAAFWMAAHFGMTFDDRETSPIGNPYQVDIALLMEGNDLKSPISRYVVHPDSLALLVPKEGDLTRMTWLDGSTSVREWDKFDDEPSAALDRDIRVQPIIIQRDGKAFHWPESEAA